MSFPYQVQPAPWGTTARARPGGSEGNREKSPPVTDCWFPKPKEGRTYPAGVEGARYPRYQSFVLTLAASTVFQEVARFSGRPSSISIQASAAGVDFRFRNRGASEGTALRVLSADEQDTDISTDLVEARDPAGAGGQIVSVFGVWTDPATT